MSATLEMPVKSAPKLPTTLNSGDCLTQKEFHAIYSKMPKHVRAELIGGIVYVASPMKRRHGMNQTALGGVILAYEAATPGTESGTSVTVILDQENEQQPDICLRILPEFGGRTQTTDDDYIAGAPEFVCEISDSTRSLDLNAKNVNTPKKEYWNISFSTFATADSIGSISQRAGSTRLTRMALFESRHFRDCGSTLPAFWIAICANS